MNALGARDILRLIACVFNVVDVLFFHPALIVLDVLLQGKREGENVKGKDGVHQLSCVLNHHVFPNMQHLFG